VAVTPAIVANTALVGAFGTMSQVFRKGGIRVEASNSHQDFFIKNLVAIRAEERLALAVYRPGAFGKVTGLV
jgi:HK97 family phage major capsid protein